MYKSKRDDQWSTKEKNTPPYKRDTLERNYGGWRNARDAVIPFQTYLPSSPFALHTWNEGRIWEIQTGWTWYGWKFPAHQSQETDRTRRFVRYASDFISCKKGAQKTWDTVIRTNYQLRITPLADCWCTDALATKPWQHHSNENRKIK